MRMIYEFANLGGSLKGDLKPGVYLCYIAFTKWGVDVK